MEIFVDADACPVKDIIVNLAKQYNIKVNMFFDTSHIYSDGYSRVITVDKAHDSVDIAIVNMIKKGDIAVTQDYALASLLLAKGVYPVHQNGYLYTEENIDRMLFERHISQKLRHQGKHSSKFKKRTSENDKNFELCLKSLIEKIIN